MRELVSSAHERTDGAGAPSEALASVEATRLIQHSTIDTDALADTIDACLVENRGLRFVPEGLRLVGARARGGAAAARAAPRRVARPCALVLLPVKDRGDGRRGRGQAATLVDAMRRRVNATGALSHVPSSAFSSTALAAPGLRVVHVSHGSYPPCLPSERCAPTTFTFGTLPMRPFTGGHTWFNQNVQEMEGHEQPQHEPITVHFTFQFGDTGDYPHGKRQRAREVHAFALCDVVGLCGLLCDGFVSVRRTLQCCAACVTHGAESGAPQQ